MSANKFASYSDAELETAICEIGASIEKAKLEASSGEVVDPDAFHRLVRAHRHAIHEQRSRRQSRRLLEIKQVREKSLEKRRLGAEMAREQMKRSIEKQELKARNVALHNTVERAEKDMFNRLVRQEIGEERFRELWAMVNAEMARKAEQEAA